jgi:S-formylglutathione hydrolase FrmB
MVLTCKYNSPVLDRNTQINVIVPTPKKEGESLGSNFKVLYLLHGLHGDADSWLHYSNISRYAQDAGIVVVMPSVNNSFYQDMAHGERFFTYMTQELPEYIQGIFPVSKKPEDTFIAGLSMGGYGAWYIGLSCPEKFAAAASLSGAVDIAFRATPVPQGQMTELPGWMRNCFGDVRTLPGSDKDVFALMEKAQQKGCLPRLYQSCGTADFLYGMNLCSYRKLTEMGIAVAWKEIPGKAHEWDLWDEEIRKVIDWMLK